MATRAKTKRRPAAKKTVRAKKTLSANAKTHLKAYKDLEKKINETWTKLRQDVRRRNVRAILKGRNDLMLLLGECNYMTNECKRVQGKTKRR